MNNRDTIAIIILNWNTYKYTFNCIRSLKLNNYKNFKIILVDNCSNDNSVILLKKDFNDIKFIVNKKNLGFSGGNNVGMNYAVSQKYRYIMLLNSDTEVEKNFLLPLLNKLKQNEDLAAVQPLILNFFNKSSIWNAGGSFNKFFGIPLTRFKNKLIDKSIKFDEKTSWITGCCILIKTSVIKQTGLLDENFFAYYEDVDFSIRIRELNYNLGFVKESVIFHHSSISLKANNHVGEGSLSPFAHYLNVKNHIILLKKHRNLFNFFGIVLFQILKITSYFFYFLIRLRFNKLQMVFRGLYHGLKSK